MEPQVDVKHEEEIKKAREELINLAGSNEKINAPVLLRLAYAYHFTIANSHQDTKTETPQCANNNNNNNNLQTEIEKIKAKYTTITYHDLYQLAGTVAVEALDGPTTIEFVHAAGRKDSKIKPDESCLPDDNKQDASDLKKVFKKVGISDPKHIVALCGGLKLARSGVKGQALKFDNSYFMDLNNKKKNENSSSTGNALLEDPDFYKCVQNYAKDKNAFFSGYKEAHKKLSEFVLPDSPSIIERGTSALQQATVVQRAVGVAVAAAVVIFSFFYLINRKKAKHSSQQFH